MKFDEYFSSFTSRDGEILESSIESSVAPDFPYSLMTLTSEDLMP